tara:strand:+ start:151 stop:720 length:570 start_codon:yes stop_codon:yes gene_type:complete
MNKKLQEIATLTSGVYAKPDYSPDTLYLQSVHFDEYGHLNPLLKPQLNVDGKTAKHLLNEGDILFAAKGINNFGVVYQAGFGKAVASSSFIVVRIKQEAQDIILPEYLAWFLSNTPAIGDFHRRQLGTTIPSISIKKLSEIEVQVPSIEKQHLITRIQQLRNKQKDLIMQLEAARESQIQQLLINALNN